MEKWDLDAVLKFVREELKNNSTNTMAGYPMWKFIKECLEDNEMTLDEGDAYVKGVLDTLVQIEKTEPDTAKIAYSILTTALR
jgi:hypothetical protein